MELRVEYGASCLTPVECLEKIETELGIKFQVDQSVREKMDKCRAEIVERRQVADRIESAKKALSPLVISFVKELLKNHPEAKLIPDHLSGILSGALK